MKRLRHILPRETRLPDAVYRDLVAMLFSMRSPVVGLGMAYVVVGVLIAHYMRDPVVVALSIAAVLVTGARLWWIDSYRGRGKQRITRAEMRRWERGYAIGNYAFALLLAGLNVRVLASHQPLLHMASISLVFVFAAGIVARISVRPQICVLSLAFATVPTVLALAVHATMRTGAPVHGPIFIAEAVLMGSMAILSLETIHYLHNAVVRSVTVKHDLTFLAKQDALTGLPNRLELRERFQQSVGPIEETKRRVALHFLDLDGFKAVNDRHGHPAGDALLKIVAQRLTRMLRAEDTVARLGGDEFVVIQAAIEHRSEAEMLARRIIKNISAPYDVGGTEMKVSVSIGIAIAPDEGLDFDLLAKCADAALYRSKAGGKNQFHFCTHDEAEAALTQVA